MNLRELIKQFRVLSKDMVRKYLWPDEELIPWFAEAEKEAAQRARLIRDSDEITLSIGDKSCDLPSGMFDVQYAELRAVDGTVYEIHATDHVELTATRPGWRTKTDRPREFIDNGDGTLTLGYVCDAEYTLYVEGFRTPKNPLSSESDEPEIAEDHHSKLVDWVFFRAYSKPDVDTLNPGKSADGEDRFTKHFGKRLNADLRRRQNASRPHRNRCHL